MSELELLLESLSREMHSESLRFVEIDKLKSAKLEKLRNVQIELECEKKERLILQNLLKGKDELESNFNRAEGIVDALRREVCNLNSEIDELRNEKKELCKKNSENVAELNKRIANLKSQFATLTNESQQELQEKRMMIDQLTNSMSEAATQLMETQDNDKGFRIDIERKERQIFDLGHEISNLKNRLLEANDQVADLQLDMQQATSKLASVFVQRDSLVEENVHLRENLALEKNSIQRLEIEAVEAAQMQKRLIGELESLPVINQRLESDCVFLRDDVKNQAQRMKDLLVENETLAQRIKLVDSILTPEQRSNFSTTVVVNNFLEIRKLQIETMELRMRLVDSQGARDKAQSQVMAQSEIILKLEKQAMRKVDENYSPEKKIQKLDAPTPKSGWKWR